MTITFHGAAQNVTGSKHLIESQGYKLLLDCGLFQGQRKVAREQNTGLPFNASQIDAVIVSHGHADHCGMLPALVKAGFQGNIYATNATSEVMRYILLDSAKIQEQDANYYNDRLPVGEDPIYPLYTSEDVELAMTRVRPVPYFRVRPQWTILNERIRFKFYDAGHILGSSVIYIEIVENGKTHTLAFSGDLGRRNVPILHPPEYIKEPVETMLMESTYGHRNHRTIDEAKDELAEIVQQAVKHRTKIIVPAFSLGRTQELVYLLHELTDSHKIPRIPIFIDSPLAGNLSEVFMRHSEDFDQESWQDFGVRGESPLAFRNLTYTQSIEESKALNTKRGPFMIISASGMAEGGRILHHLKNNIEDNNAIILFTGYQAEHTLGRKIIEGISPVRIFGRQYNVNAQIRKINELSAHADQAGLLDYIDHIKDLKNVFVVHTETDQGEAFMTALHEKYPSLNVDMPEKGKTVKIS
jgi:metallo-beta-lactamase family protein